MNRRTFIQTVHSNGVNKMLLRANKEPGTMVKVRNTNEENAEIERAEVSKNGVIRDRAGRCYSDASYEVVEVIDD